METDGQNTHTTVQSAGNGKIIAGENPGSATPTPNATILLNYADLPYMGVQPVNLITQR